MICAGYALLLRCFCFCAGGPAKAREKRVSPKSRVPKGLPGDSRLSTAHRAPSYDTASRRAQPAPPPASERRPRARPPPWSPLPPNRGRVRHGEGRGRGQKGIRAAEGSARAVEVEAVPIERCRERLAFVSPVTGHSLHWLVPWAAPQSFSRASRGHAVPAVVLRAGRRSTSKRRGPWALPRIVSASSTARCRTRMTPGILRRRAEFSASSTFGSNSTHRRHRENFRERKFTEKKGDGSSGSSCSSCFVK